MVDPDLAASVGAFDVWNLEGLILCQYFSVFADHGGSRLAAWHTWGDSSLAVDCQGWVFPPQVGAELGDIAWNAMRFGAIGELTGGAIRKVVVTDGDPVDWVFRR